MNTYYADFYILENYLQFKMNFDIFRYICDGKNII